MASVSSGTLERLYVDEGKSIPDVARLLGLTYYQARKKLIESKVPLRSRAEGIRRASPKLGRRLIGKKRFFTDEWIANIKKARIAYAEVHAKGVRVNSNGYIEFTRGQHKGRLQHIVFMEEVLGRRLAPNEVVHHKDECRSNNEISNLIVMTRAEHTKHHRQNQKGKCNGKR